MLRPNNRREPRAGARNHLLLLCVFVSCTLLGLFALDAAAQKSAEKKKKPDGLELELVDGGELAAPEEEKKEAPSKPLGEKETRAVIERLGKKAPEAEEKKFSFPSSTLPPPVTGTNIKEVFPPPQKVPGIKVPANSKIEVLRYQPEGSLPLASHLSVTFSEAMVALDTHESLAGEELPVILTPPVKGVWRWVGTKTLFFEPGGTKGKTRFPMASIYKVEVPGETRSAAGAQLKKKVSWTFSTPAPTIVSAHPQGGPKRIDPVMVLVFDQRINPDAVLEYITVRTAAKKYALRRATEADLAADARAKKIFSAA
ncbi:MAG: Ig-like domain-containing protein, partial [Planctomycetota bacterium]|nr:Ig-like domain-containing protein [Planctomycetota bacterium]